MYVLIYEIKMSCPATPFAQHCSPLSCTAHHSVFVSLKAADDGLSLPVPNEDVTAVTATDDVLAAGAEYVHALHCSQDKHFWL